MATVDILHVIETLQIMQPQILIKRVLVYLNQVFYSKSYIHLFTFLTSSMTITNQ